MVKKEEPRKINIEFLQRKFSSTEREREKEREKEREGERERGRERRERGEREERERGERETERALSYLRNGALESKRQQ